MAVPSLERLSWEHEIVGVLTNPDRIRGRGRRLTASPVKEKALALELPLVQPEKLDREFREAMISRRPSLLVVVAYGRIFQQVFLDIFPRGGVNLHPSLLPLYRGCSPINAAILNGDAETGITIQRLVAAMDSGDILAQEVYPLGGTETTGGLTTSFAQAGSDLLVKTLRAMEEGTLKPRAQEEAKASYCGKLGKNDGRISWSDPAVKIERTFRAYTPWPGVYTHFKGKKLNILGAALFKGEFPEKDPRVLAAGTVLGIDKKEGILIQTGRGILSVRSLQLEAKKAMDHLSFCNGTKELIGSRLGGNE